jgi:hypothetical protein
VPAGKTTVPPDPAASRALAIAAVSSVAPSPRAPNDVTRAPAGSGSAGGGVGVGGGVVAAGGAVVVAGGVVAAGGVLAAGGVVADGGGGVDGCVVGGGTVGADVVLGVAVAVMEGAALATDVDAGVAALVGTVAVDVPFVEALGFAALGVGSTARAAGAARSSLVTEAVSAEEAAVGVGPVPPGGASIASTTRRRPRASAKTGTTAKRMRRPVLPQRLGLGPPWVGQAAAQGERIGRRASDG